MSGQEDLNRVLNLISLWLTTINSHNTAGLFDINKLAEGLALKLLNEIYGYDLENLNYEKSNYPAIDLGDKTNKIGFQISTRTDSRKIKESLEKFVKGPHKTYSNGIRFLILHREKRPQSSKKKYKEIYPDFDPDKHILTADHLISEIREIYDVGREKFYRIKRILEKELGGKSFKEIDRIEHESGAFFKRKVGEIFKLMGFELEYNKRIEDCEIDIFINKKKSLGSKCEYYICHCHDQNEEVGIEIIKRFRFERGEVIRGLDRDKKARNCDAVIISSNGFTEPAKNAADNDDIIYYTYNQLLSELMDFEEYLTKLIRDFESSALEKLYIEPNCIPERTMEEINSFDYVKQWLTNPGRKQILLLGDCGTGKTSFARKLAYNLAVSYKRNPYSEKIPFFIDLSQCQSAVSLETLLLEQLKNAKVKPVNEARFLKLLSEGKILLIFDAFDEMAAMSSEEIILNNFRELSRAVMGEAKVILTSRTHYFRSQYEVDGVLEKKRTKGISKRTAILHLEISNKPESEIVYLKEFSELQIKKYLRKSVGDKWQESYQKIQNIYNLHDLSSRPLLLDMIVRTLPKINEKSKYEFNLGNLYELYTFKWMEREEHRLRILTEVMEEVVEALAFKLWQEGRQSIHYSVIPDILRYHLKLKINSIHDLDTADYEMRTASLLVRDECGNYSFAHKSFQEFFIARKIGKELLEGHTNVLDSVLFSKEIVFFLLHLVEDENHILEKVSGLLKAEAHNRISDNAFFIFYTVLKMVFLDLQFSFKNDIEFSIQDEDLFKKMVRSRLPEDIDIRGVSLSKWTLPYIVNRHSDFTKSHIEDSIFLRKFFEGVKFNDTYMKGSDFSYSVFKNVCFERVDAHHCTFKNCQFEDCTIKGSDFSMSNFMDTSFESCIIKDNDFTGAGFYQSGLDMKKHKEENYFLGAGVPDVETVKLFPVLVDLGHENSVKTVAISPDNRFIVSGSDDETVKIWDMENGNLITSLKEDNGRVNSVFVSSDNRRIVSGCSDHTVRLWDIESGRLIMKLNGHTGGVLSVFVSPDNQRIVSGSSDHTVKLWDLESGCLISTLNGHKGGVNSVFVSPDNKCIVSCSDDKAVKLWDLANGTPIKTLNCHKDKIWSICVTPDNRRIVTGSSDRTVKVWDLQSGRLIKTLEGHKDWIRTVFVSTAPTRVVSGSDDRTVKLWDIESGDLLETFEGHEGIVNSASISPDNRMIISGSFDETIKVWDRESGRIIRTLEGHKELVETDINNPKNLHRLYYRDHLALYPARDLPELKLNDLERRY